MTRETPAPDTLEQDVAHSKTLRPGSDHYRAYVGPPQQYDFMGATQFRLLTGLGLREDHSVVDIGCGSLRAGRYLIQYLLPGRYTGVEPNSWLWQQAIEREIGADLARIKQPRLLAEDDFRLSGIAEGSVDFAVAQSIYSHTGSDVLTTSLAAVARRLAPSGQFLFTVVTPDSPAAAGKPDGQQSTGWIYPGCVVFTVDDIIALCARFGLHAQRLDWFHPRQTWFRATLDPALRLTDAMQTALGTGKPLFDVRFP